MHFARGTIEPALISNEIHFIRRPRLRGGRTMRTRRVRDNVCRWAPRETRGDRLPAGAGRGPRARENRNYVNGVS